MKKILFFIFALVLLTGCDPDKDDPIKKIKIDPLATIDIKPDPKGWGGLKSTNPEHLSPLEIVEQATALQNYNPNIMDNAELWERAFSDRQRDLNPDDPKLMMDAIDIITVNGDLIPDFIEGRNFILLKFDLTVTDAPRDTLGYIPNATLIAAETAIKAAYAAGDSETVYRLFEEAFKFLPITGTEYKALKEAGEQ